MKKPTTNTKNSSVRVGLVVPHMFMQQQVLQHVIFSPAQLALTLAAGLASQSLDITLFTPGPVDTPVRNITADLTYFERELAGRGDTYVDLLKKHPFTFITLARQVQAELIAKAYSMANADKLDVVHIYTNEEEIALPFAALCSKPVVFTHHDPFNFLVKYKNNFPKYANLNWISLSYAQRKGMPAGTNWVANIYHGMPATELVPLHHTSGDYIAYLGRIIEPKGVHLAIAAVKQYNHKHASMPLTLRVAGKHYSGNGKDRYWTERIHPAFGKHIVDAGYIALRERQQFLGNARALLVPSIFEEPFGMVAIEALACGTPVIALDSGALPELITTGATGRIVRKVYRADGVLDDDQTASALCDVLTQLETFDRTRCRQAFEARFTAERMCAEHAAVYRQLIAGQDQS